MQGTIKTIRLLALILTVLAVGQLHAATVGPLDGKAGPSLKPLGIPAASMHVEDLPDTGFPKALEQLGDLPSAALEWQRLAHKAHGAEREEALTNAARLNIAMGRPAVASAIINELITENPATPYAPEALYHISTGPKSEAQSGALTQLTAKFAANPWTIAAQLHDVWQQAEVTGKIKQTYGLTQAEELKTRIKKLRSDQQQKIAKAGAIGVMLPGAGHAFAGNIPQGLTVFLVWCLFTLAFLSACRHRHYAYSFLFIIPSVALWLTSPVVAMQIVRDDTHKILTTSLKGWADLRPQIPGKPAQTTSQ